MRRCALLPSVWAKPQSPDAETTFASRSHDPLSPTPLPKSLQSSPMLASACDARPRHLAQAPALPTFCPCPVTCIYPQMGEARKALAGGPQQQLDSILVGNFGAVNLRLEHQAFRIQEKLSFAAADLLAAIVAPLFATGPARFG